MSKIANTKLTKVGSSYYLHIPVKLRMDESFPFKITDDNLMIRVYGKKIVVEKYG